jgi:hypothetical protein
MPTLRPVTLEKALPKPTSGSSFEAIKSYLNGLFKSLLVILTETANTVNSLVAIVNKPTDPERLALVAKADLPDATLWTGSLLYVTDNTAQPVPAFSDGTIWRSVVTGLLIA